MSECVGGLRLFRLAGCLILLLVAAPFLSAQNVINVPADQPTIQAAINIANNGDTVLVAPGTYVENINFVGKAITVTSSGGPSVTTIDGGAKGSVVTFDTGETASSKLNGFTITNGFQNGLAGGGISISGASPTITGNVITGNHAAVGIGIYVNGGSPLIQNNTITANDQKGAGDGGEGGGGILVSGSNSITTAPQIIGNTITNNSVGSGGNGGGISLTYFSSPLIQNNLIQGNTAYNGGGGISVQSYNSPAVVQNVILGNSAGSGGGIYVSPSSSSQTQTFLNNTIAGNTAVDNTSGVLVYGFGQFATFTNDIVVASTGQVAVTCNSTYSSLSPVFSYNDAFSSSGQNWAGICDTISQPGNISADPLFLSATDFHVQWGSPAVDAGNNSAPNLPATDFDGNPRVFDGNGDGIATVDLGAYELSPTTITLAPNSLTFGPQPLGTASASQAVTLANTGNQKLLLAISTSPSFSEADNCGASLPGGASCTINVSFSPTTPGNLSGSLTLKDTASGNPHSVALAGTGGAPVASLNPTSLNFGAQPVGTTSPAETVTLSNTGNDAMAISSITSSGDFAQTNTCGATLVAGANCSITVTFAPIAAGTRSGSLMVADNASGSPQSVTLTGTGTAPNATLSPASLAFSGQPVGSTSAVQSVTLTNSGSAPLTIFGIAATGDFAQTNNCGNSLAPGASCAINVTFTPSAVGSRSGTLVVSDNGNPSPQSLGVSGTGVDFGISVTPSSATVPRGSSTKFSVSVTPLGGAFPDGVSLSCSGLPAASSCAFSPVSVTPGSSGASSVITVTTDKLRTPLGNFTLTITGVSGALTHSGQAQLTVTKH